MDDDFLFILHVINTYMKFTKFSVLMPPGKSSNFYWKFSGPGMS